MLENTRARKNVLLCREITWTLKPFHQGASPPPTPAPPGYRGRRRRDEESSPPPCCSAAADRRSGGGGWGGRPWLMCRQCRPKNIFPLPSIFANVTCHAGHSLPSASGVHLPPADTLLAGTARVDREKPLGTIGVGGQTLFLNVDFSRPRWLS